MNLSYRAGVAKEEMTCLVPGVGMMGYGEPRNVCHEIATPLWVRALVLQDSNKKTILFLHLEQCFPTMAIKEEILTRLAHLHPEWMLTDEDLLLSAQHTHSAPGGYSHYGFYNLTSAGFQTRVFNKVVSAAVHAAEEAFAKMVPVNLAWGEIEISVDKEVSFNRSMVPYLNNPDVPKLKVSDRPLAVDRRMQGLFFRTEEGKLIAHMNWFAVHCTSISHFNSRIHHDNKGVAADLFEKAHPGCIAFFMQASAGDVSPNFIWDKKTRIMRGKFADQYENAAFNGEIQFRESERIKPDHEVQGKIESYHCYVDMAKKAAPPAHGVAFLRGTLEGPGLPPVAATLLGVSSRIRRVINCLLWEKEREFFRKHGNKEVVVDHRNGNFMGLPFSFWKTIPSVPVHPVNHFQNAAKVNALETLPWAPAIIPLQIFRLGNLLIVCFPGEITTTSGKRLHDAVEKASEGCGIEKIIISSYSNAYMGYITTPEEYDKQAYEGGHNLYGRRALPAMIECYVQLVKKMKGDYCELDDQKPFHFPADELALRSV
jgi:neutral ceramidase